MAFAKVSTFPDLQASLRDRLKKGMKATFVIGTDFYQSDPDLLDKLRKLTPGRNVRVFMGDFEANLPTFHPKVYVFRRGANASVIVGSANLTSGGLRKNHELSILLQGNHADIADEIEEWVVRLIADREIIPVTPAALAKYRRAFDINKVEQQIARKRIRAEIARPTGGLEAVRHLLAQMRSDKSEAGFDALVAKRREDRAEGIALMRSLATPQAMSDKRFLTQYKRLFKTFHSAGHHRGQSRVARNHEQFREGLRVLLQGNGGPKQMLEAAYEVFEDVDRTGTNLITEILHLLNHNKFAVLNKNSVAGITLCGFSGFPRAPNRKLVDPSKYEQFCSDANQVQNELGLANLSELDTVFNAQYWLNR
ncbi:phospholipase D-like domain-containing protein [Rhizobium johnstonii]|uniref:phospholipase D-like domain-containing protein n=1 Tax=Rhizobium johnstonii TaxID=3019933 RepID=UPI003F9CE338